MRESYGLRKLINATVELIGKDITNSDPEFDAWEVKTKQFFVSQYGSDSFMIWIL